MSYRKAVSILNRIKDGDQSAPEWLITLALQTTGDIDVFTRVL
jgi:hypothetical protein